MRCVNFACVLFLFGTVMFAQAQDVTGRDKRDPTTRDQKRNTEAQTDSISKEQQNNSQEQNQSIREEPAQELKPDIAEENVSEKNNPDPTIKPRYKQIKPQVDRSGSFIGSTAIPPMPSLERSASNADKQRDENSEFEPGELLLSSADMKTAIAIAHQLQSFGLRVKSRKQLQQLGLVITRFRLPTDAETKVTLAKIQKQFPDITVDTNQRYQLLTSSRQTWAYKMLAWPETSNPCLENKTPIIGMLDTALNPSHPALMGRSIYTEKFIEGELAPATHATAVASLLVGKSENGYPGLVPHAKLYAANVFRQRGESSDTTTSALLLGLDWVSSQNVKVINLSLGGKQNRIFEQAIERVLSMGVAVVAASGNQGPDADPVYPAAQKGVIAVSAVDAAGKVYSQANQGEYIDFAAPGVDVWAADGDKGGQYHSGTSFAAPFVTALLAIKSEFDEGLKTGFDAIKNEAEDAGLKGKDTVFGWGLIKSPKECQP